LMTCSLKQLCLSLHKYNT